MADIGQVDLDLLPLRTLKRAFRLNRLMRRRCRRPGGPARITAEAKAELGRLHLPQDLEVVGVFQVGFATKTIRALLCVKGQLVAFSAPTVTPETAGHADQSTLSAAHDTPAAPVSNRTGRALDEVIFDAPVLNGGTMLEFSDALRRISLGRSRLAVVPSLSRPMRSVAPLLVPQQGFGHAFCRSQRGRRPECCWMSLLA